MLIVAIATGEPGFAREGTMRLRRASNDELVQIDPCADKLAAGGEGAVYRVEMEKVEKIYQRPDRDRRKKIEAMLLNPPEDGATKGHHAIAWPDDMLVDANRRSEF